MPTRKPTSKKQGSKPAFPARFRTSFVSAASTGTLRGLAAAAVILASAANLDAKPMVAAHDEPRITTGDDSVVVPVERPDPALTLPLAPAAMELPQARPNLEDRLPATPATIGEELTAVTGIAPETDPVRFRLRSGEGMAQLLERGGFDASSGQYAIRQIAKHMSMRALPVGFEITVLPAGSAHGAGLRLAVDDDMTLALFQDTAGDWRQRLSLRAVERYLTYVGGTIDSSLYKSGIDAGMTEEVFNTFVQVFGFTVDFQREVRKGDHFEALYETKRDMITGDARSRTTLRYISMTLSGDRIEYFNHQHQDGDTGWYDGDGKSAARPLMRTPVNGARLSSSYGMRKHPILGYSKMHRGLDFAAPTGTPIMAAGSGVVEYAGRNGNYGKYIRIRHSGTYKTAYAHLSRIAKGIAPGTRVKQGQVIGKVGSTGRSTGPHLHYEILVNSRQVNPLTIRLPAGKSMPEEERAYFERTVSGVSEELGARGIIRFASN